MVVQQTQSCPMTGATSMKEPGSSGCPVVGRAAEFDPFSDGYQQDPAAYVAWARSEEPIFFSPKLGYWVVTRYHDVQAIFRDNVTFSPSVALENITPTSDEAKAVLTSYDFGLKRTLVNEDEPAHMPRRRLLIEPFEPAHLAHHEPMVRRLAREFVDKFIDKGAVDLVDGMLFELPLTVALNFLGVPEDDMDVLRQYSVAHTVNIWGRPGPAEQVAVAEAVGKFWQYSGKVLDKMRRDPDGPGWMKFALRMQPEHPEIVTDSFLHSMMMAGIVAAHETTAIAATNAIKLLLENREVWEEICADPTLIPNAVEECLRIDGSVSAWRRIATEDATVGGVQIPKGAKLLIMQSSANHDERYFEDPEMVDIRRVGASEHLTFGYGAHQCMGKNLARMELQIILEELTRRIPHLQLSPQKFSYVRNTSFRGPEHLLVAWDPQLNPERADPSILTASAPVSIEPGATKQITRPVVVTRRTQLTDGVVRLRLESTHGKPFPAWSPGSHIDVVCGDTGHSRQYSLCGDPTDRMSLEVAVLRESDGRGGSAWVHDDAIIGSRLEIRGPRNHFRLDTSAKRYIFIAGGIGVTAISAMARDAQRRGADYDFHYAGRSRTSMAMVEELQAIHGDRLHLWVSDEGRRAPLATLLAHVPEGVQVYCCGPERMIADLESISAGWPDDTLHVEHFTSRLVDLDPSIERAFNLELNNSGVTVRVEATQTILQALRAAKINVPSDCEEGLCGTCQVGVVSGDIDHRDAVLTAAEREEGNLILTCCSRACGDRLTLDL
ncbi:cytochrome P450 [Arthrobacter nitrophenolicus]|uniref:Cytochrome P450 n=2 Tax=Arthrobacter nitrophenolicus TaxID=683150 RepID=A0A4R5XTA7_9MICC|nr:cytochrome P450 [Arthrobacter nitrophenolicus]